MFKIINGQNGITPVYLAEMFSTNIGRSVYNLRTSRWNLALPAAPGRGGGVLPYMGSMGMCRCEGYVFQAVYSRIGYINQGVWV